MSSKNDGGPAFPQHGWTSNPEVLERMKGQGGMTLRDWFAAMAMQGILSNPETVRHGQDGPSSVCNAAFNFADKMLKARER